MSNSALAFSTDYNSTRDILQFDLISQNPIMIGTLEFPMKKSLNSISIGERSGFDHQSTGAIAIGEYAGNRTQGADAIAIAAEAGAIEQRAEAIALGVQSGMMNQGTRAIALGYHTGRDNQNYGAVAIGAGAGNLNQGSYAIAIGYNAGKNNQASRSIVLNASTTDFPAPDSGLYVAPIRYTTMSPSLNVLVYNETTREIFRTNISGSGGLTDEVMLLINNLTTEVDNLRKVVNSLTMDPDTYTP
jgi:hypothetical protein